MTYHIGEPKGATIQIEDETESRIRYLLNAKSGNIANLNNTIQEKDGDDQLVTITGMAFPIRRSFFFFLFDIICLFFALFLYFNVAVVVVVALFIVFFSFFFLHSPFFFPFPFIPTFFVFSSLSLSFPPIFVMPHIPRCLIRRHPGLDVDVVVTHANADDHATTTTTTTTTTTLTAMPNSPAALTSMLS